MTVTIPDAITANADMMENYARHLKSQLPTEQQAIIDTILLAEEVRKNRYSPQHLIPRLRNEAKKYQDDSMMLYSLMQLIADTIEQKPNPMN